MSDYKQKYLKYKNKYFELKNKLNEQTGGNLYTPGTYVFFLREKPFVNLPSTAYLESLTPILTDPKVKSIDNFNLFTDYIGDCALFLRVKSSMFGSIIGSIQQHRYDTVYPNKPTTNMIKNISSNAEKFNNQNCKPIQIEKELKEGFNSDELNPIVNKINNDSKFTDNKIKYVLVISKSITKTNISLKKLEDEVSILKKYEVNKDNTVIEINSSQ